MIGLLTRLVSLLLAACSIAVIAIILLPPAYKVMLILVLAELGMIVSVDRMFFRKSGAQAIPPLGIRKRVDLKQQS